MSSKNCPVLDLAPQLWFDGTVTISIRRISGPEFSMIAPRLVDIYLSAMGYSPSVHSQRLHAWRSDTVMPGFTAIVATTQNDVVGLAYGFLGSRDTWWDRQLRKGLRGAGHDEDSVRNITGDYFEIAEIHVHPGMQGAGIGRRLLSELLWNAPAGSALLSTPEVPGESNNAFGLYRSMGFQDVLRHCYFDGDNRPFAILGRTLPLEQPAPPARSRR
ncbi:MAG TPA: GNAT family N-acetyltransferase [Corynebacterium sp.]|nr:GNAT family N-acetyltransferase [Corynebacterium sp.]